MLRSPFEGSHKKDGKTRGQEEGSGTFRYANGDFYVGEWYAGKREGHGAYQDSEGNVYEGEWKADEMEGRGTIRSRSADGAAIYEGEWKAGQPCGLLILPGRTPKVHRGPTMDEKNKSRAEKIQAALFKHYPFVTFATVEPSKDEGSETQSSVDGSKLRPQQLWLEEVSKEVSGMASAGMTEVTALAHSYFAMLSADGATFYRYGRSRAKPFLGTIAFARDTASHVASIWGATFTNTSLAEDLSFVERAIRACHRFSVIDTVPIVYTRHLVLNNTYRADFKTVYKLKPSPTPSFVSPALLTAFDGSAPL
eukprot:jgi/Chrpa1/6898/Chrysochromulina_OHIO_Genome00002177-RA